MFQLVLDEYPIMATVLGFPGYEDRMRDLTPEADASARARALDILERAEIDHARRNPPLGTPATVRGRYIREWAADEELISANWHAVYLGQGRECKVVRLDQVHARPAEQAADQRKRSPRNSDRN